MKSFLRNLGFIGLLMGVAGCNPNPDDKIINVKGESDQAVFNTTGLDHSVFMNYRLMESQRILQFALSSSGEMASKVGYDKGCQDINVTEDPFLLKRVMVLKPALKKDKKKNRILKYSCRSKNSKGQTKVFATEVYEMTYGWVEDPKDLLDIFQGLKKDPDGLDFTQEQKVEAYQKLLGLRYLIQVKYSSENYEAKYESNKKETGLSGTSLVSEKRHLLATRNQDKNLLYLDHFSVTYSIDSKVNQYIKTVTTTADETYHPQAQVDAVFNVDEEKNWVGIARNIFMTLEIPTYFRTVKSNDYSFEEFTVRNFVSLKLNDFGYGVEFSQPSKGEKNQPSICLSVGGEMDLYFKQKDQSLFGSLKLVKSQKGSFGINHQKTGQSLERSGCVTRRVRSHSEMPYELVLGRVGL